MGGGVYPDRRRRRDAFLGEGQQSLVIGKYRDHSALRYHIEGVIHELRKDLRPSARAENRFRRHISTCRHSESIRDG